MKHASLVLLLIIMGHIECLTEEQKTQLKLECKNQCDEVKADEMRIQEAFPHLCQCLISGFSPNRTAIDKDPRLKALIDLIETRNSARNRTITVAANISIPISTETTKEENTSPITISQHDDRVSRSKRRILPHVPHMQPRSLINNPIPVKRRLAPNPLPNLKNIALRNSEARNNLNRISHRMNKARRINKARMASRFGPIRLASTHETQKPTQPENVPSQSRQKNWKNKKMMGQFGDENGSRMEEGLPEQNSYSSIITQPKSLIDDD